MTGGRVAEHHNPAPADVEMPNEILQETFEVKYEEDRSRNFSVNRKYDSRERSKQLHITNKGVPS
jgi:hypothetical protein